MTENSSQARELLGAWALNAVDEQERLIVEGAIASDPELAAEARELRETVSELAEADAQEPPAHLRDAVWAQIRENPGDTAGQTPGEPEEVAQQRDELVRLRRRRRWQALAAAAAIVVAVAIPATVAVNQADRADQAEQQAGQAEQQAAEALEQSDQLTEALMDPAAEVVSEDLPDGSRAVAVLGEDSALFAAENVSELQAQDYQLWVLDEEEAISVGVMDWDEGSLAAHVEQFPAGAALAVTTEPLGGSEQPTSEPLVVLAAP